MSQQELNHSNTFETQPFKHAAFVDIAVHILERVPTPEILLFHEERKHRRIPSELIDKVKLKTPEKRAKFVQRIAGEMQQAFIVEIIEPSSPDVPQMHTEGQPPSLQ